MKHFPRTLFAFAIAGAVAGVAGADDSQQSAKPRHFADLRTTGVNRELSHAPIYGTFFDEASAADYRKTPSKYTLDLNGTWKFQLFGKPDEVPDDVIRPDYADSAWMDMKVPSNWQNDMRVPDRGVYINNGYLY